MEHLLRTRVGIFHLEDALTLGEVQQIMDSDPRQLNRHIIPVDSFFREAPAVHILSEDMKYLRNGNALSAANTVEKLLPKEDRIRVYDEEGTFYALYRYVPGRKRALPVKMFHDTDSRENDRK